MLLFASECFLFLGDIVDSSADSPPPSLKSRTHSVSTGGSAPPPTSALCCVLRRPHKGEGNFRHSKREAQAVPVLPTGQLKGRESALGI